MRNSSGLSILAGVFALSPFAGAQEKVPVFPSAVELITVDAVVLDKTGQPVRGLKAEDFAITEDGKPQEVSSFEAIDLGDAAPGEAVAATPVATNIRPPRAVPGRAFVLLVDDLGLSAPNTPALAKALARFMEGAFDPGDEVTLGTTSGAFWWSVRWPDGREDLRVLADRLRGQKLAGSSSDYMSDWEAYQIDHFGGGGGGASPDVPSGTGRPDAAGAAPATPVIVSGGGIIGRVADRWTATRVCAQENRGACLQMVQMRARERDSIRRDRTRAVMAGVERAVFSLTGVRGRKELLLFSEGFLDDQDLSVVKQVAGACRDANLVVNFVDARGLVGSIEETTAAFSGGPPVPQEQALIQLEGTRFESEGSVALAEDTGGVAVTGTNDLGAGARRILDESRVYYLLGYYPPAGKGSRDWRKVKVEVKRPGARVRTRKGYTLRPAGSEMSAGGATVKEGKNKKDGKETAGSLPVSRALANSVDLDGIPLRAMAYVFDEAKPGKARVLLAVEADLSGLDYRGGGGKPRANLAVTIATTQRDTQAAWRADQRVEAASPSSGASGWSLFTHEFELEPGVTQARVVARDEGTGRLGAVTARFEVPALGGLRLSTPILTDAVRTGARPEPVLVARRVFRPSDTLYCQFQVYGAGKDAQGAARVEAGYLLRQASGDRVRGSEPSPITAPPGGPVMRLLGLRLESLPAGEYELVLALTDTTNGQTLERIEPFRLE